MPHLIVREPGLVPFSVPLHREIVVGRLEKSDLVLRDHRVSREHAVIRTGKKGWEIVNRSKTHGTFANGVRIDRQDLSEGDRIQLGSVVLEFRAAEDRAEVIYGQSTASAKVPSGEGAADRRVRLIYEVARAIREAAGSEELVGRMLDTILDLFGCERALAGIPADQGDGLRRVMRRRGGAGGGEMVISQPILELMMVKRQALIWGSVAGEGGRSPEGSRAPSSMGTPMESGGRVIGFIYVEDRRSGRFIDEDLDYLIALGRLCAAALENGERFQQALASAPASGRGAILGESEPIQALRAKINKYGPASGTNVLIRGESGTGKELVAWALHAASGRAGRPFVAVNCAAIPEQMIESELFGHVKGAFTGAVKDRKGSFELASGGTLFLDEIGDLSLTAQAKVLRAIQELEILPVGGERLVRVDTRVLSATHKDLAGEMAAGRFRLDLYYRIAVIEIAVPPLRDRPGDVDVLAHGLLRLVASGMGKRLEGFTPAALGALRSYPWPGNVRELRNVVECAAINAESSRIDVCDLSDPVRNHGRSKQRSDARAPLAMRFAAIEVTERRLVEEALQVAGGNVAEAARQLGITRVMMKRRMDRFGLGEVTSDWNGPGSGNGHGYGHGRGHGRGNGTGKT